ncbi:MAG: ATP synthase F1 subunit delta [Actinomycetota bacterium]|nr:ATP synthase F1 subunit delta [Actinomycetota bacterium]
MEELAEVYSRALFQAAQDADKLDVVHDQVGEFADALAENRDLSVFFFSPYFSTEEKKEGLGKVLEGADDLVRNFLELLIEKHRMPAVYRIRRSYDALWEEENKLLPVEVTSAIELDKQTVKQIGDRIGERTGRRVQLESRVDPDILGGIVVRVGDRILDASIANRLESLRKQVARS